MVWLLALALLLGAAPAADATTDFVTLAYHDVADSPGDLDADAVTIQNLAAQFDWLRDQGYRVISIDDVLAAYRGERPLPPRAVLLSFDDGYVSLYTRVFPLLQAFNYPAVFALVGSWIEPPEGTMLGDAAGGPPRSRFVSWDEVREMQRSGLVEIASHSYGLHTEVPGNVEGSRYPAAVARAYGRRGYRTDIVPIQRRPVAATPVRRRPAAPRVALQPVRRAGRAARRLGHRPRLRPAHGTVRGRRRVRRARPGRPDAELGAHRGARGRPPARDGVALRAVQRRRDRGGPGRGHARHADARSRAVRRARPVADRALLPGAESRPEGPGGDPPERRPRWSPCAASACRSTS